MISLQNFISQSYNNGLTSWGGYQGNSNPPSESSGIENVQVEMDRRNNLGYGLGMWLGRMMGVREDTTAQPISTLTETSKQSERLSNYYQILFPQDDQNILYAELDPGVDDGAALLQLLATPKVRSAGEQTVKIQGLIPSVGNAVSSQTQKNTLQFLELTGNTEIEAYPGAIAPLAIENNTTAIKKMEEAINATHFYGHDGEEDVGGWPKVTMKLQDQPGYQFAASLISSRTPETAVTLISTSALTELSKTFTKLLEMDPSGSFASNINAISIMGGCFDPDYGCNAPFNVPNNKKDSEANFFFDVPATKNVFSICEELDIPILLSPLDLTQQPGLLWTDKEVKILNDIDNPVSTQWARVTKVTPYIDAKNFPNGTYPMHDLFAAAAILTPDYFNVTRMALLIGEDGQTIPNDDVPDLKKNVYVLSIPTDKQASFFSEILQEYKNFNQPEGCCSVLVEVAITASGCALLILGGIAGYKVKKSRKQRIVGSIKQPLLVDA